MFISTALVACAATALAAGATSPLQSRQGCAKGYEICNAEASISDLAPSMDDDDLASLYVDLVNSVNAVKEKRAPLLKVPVGLKVKRQDDSDDDADDGDVDVPDLCCKADAGMQCLLLEGVRISFCWDRFTTNYHFADGSYGNIVSGSYKTVDGDMINLKNGIYTLLNGETGNIYDDEGDAPPNVSDLNLPTPWTSAGVGPVIPGSELGDQATYVPATTIPERTVSGTVIPATTIPATTIPGATPATATATATGEAAETSEPSSAGHVLAARRAAPLMLVIMTAFHGLV